MFQKTKISAALIVAFGGGGALGVLPAHAQDSSVQRVEVTGSAIKRVDAEGALPVQVINREAIQRSGATSVTDLIQRLPAMQGATTESASVGGGGGGFSGASVHNIGETRTLVLLNGRRLAQFGGQTLTGFGAAIDLNTLPLSAIERVEVLATGASSLYGSDAIAGVVNFITRRNSTEGDLTLGASKPQKGGAEEKRFSLSKGFGSLEEDGFNVFFAIGADKRDPLNATQREASKTGVINFNHNGKRYQAFLGSPSAIPGNVLDDDGDIVSPYFLANGSCAPGNVRSTDPATGKTACYFDFVAALEIFPERERQQAMVSGDLKLGQNHTLFADVLLSRTESTGIIAPVPGSISIPRSSPLYDQYLTPVSGMQGSTFTQDTTAFYRVADLGRRADKNKSEFSNGVIGVRGVFGEWDYETGLSYSKSDFKNDISGYPGALALSRLRSSGLLNPFVGPGEMPAESLAAVRNIVYNGYWDGGTSELASLDGRVSRSLMNLAGGPLQMALGVNYYQEKFQGKPSLFAQAKLADPVAGTLCDPDSADPNLQCDQRFGDAAAIIPYSADRKAWGVFTEVVAPVTKTLELTGSVRYDDYSDFGSTTNGKLMMKWRPTTGLALRGSLGTGFKAPTVPQLKAAPQSFGVTSSPYDCTPELQAVATSLNAQCQPRGRQYDVVAGGNPKLKPEKSRQAHVGMVFEPVQAMSVGVDWWWVGIKDAFGQISEQEAFDNPQRYPGAWTTQRDIATGIDFLAYNQANLNLGKAYYSGIDFDVQGRYNTPIGRLGGRLVATYMLAEKVQLQEGGQYFNPVGVNEPSLSYVTFRWQGRASAELQTGKWLNSLAANFKSGYRDAIASVEVLGPNDANTGEFEDVQLKIKNYVTWDWQTQYALNSRLTFTLGVLNLTDTKVPLTLAEGGAGKGQMFGYDDRYHDIRGRTYYVNASFKF
ncbi:TonB-dependent receptor domain-containing protein [Ideonella sp. BN130291]|uniref:TonB-dependent receptor domain-containing protein n=1 Tax=Ideonella sp. BN130291 TaxID=3112940 RepID=UPI002E258C4B|nr:TonB-dependent receptor [Ideonella sp. BN130291]